MSHWNTRYLKDYGWKEHQMFVPGLECWVVVHPEDTAHKKARRQHKTIKYWNAFAQSEFGNEITKIAVPARTADEAKRLILNKVRSRIKNARKAVLEGMEG